MSSTAAASAPAEEAPRPEPGMRKFGVCLFDDPTELKAGWMSVNGSAAKRIEGTHQLPTDALYWTNITTESYFRGNTADRNPWLRHDAYLVLKLKDLLSEWGLDPANTTADYAATFASTMFSRIMTKAYQIAKECDDKVRMTSLFSSDTLRSDLRRFLPKMEYPKGETASFMKPGQAYAEFSRTAVRTVRGAKAIKLHRPRLSYAVEILTTPVPKGTWEYRSRRDLRTASPDKMAWARSSDRPVMLEITVDEIEQDLAPLYGYGNTTDRDKKIPRSWVAHPEFMVMSSFAKMDILSAYVGQDYSQLNLEMPEPIRQFLSDPYSQGSWSAGVVAETLWRAATMAEPKSRNSVQGEERPGTSWQGAWLRAADKTSGFMSAMRFADMGYNVSSYGYGWILVSVTDDQIPDLMRDGLSIGFHPNMFDCPDGLFPRGTPLPWGGDKRFRAVAQMMVTQEKSLLWHLDRLPLFQRSQREAQAHKIAVAHSKGKL